MKQQILDLRERMKLKNIDCYIVPTNDFHGSEYINAYFKTRAFVSGFTGSAGTLIVTHDDARLWVDGRYFLQGEMQLEGSGITLMKAGEPDVPTTEEYLTEVLSAGQVLAFDGSVVSARQGSKYEEIAANRGASCESGFDLVDEIWADRPALVGRPIWALPLNSAGLPFEAKIAQVRDLMRKAGATHHLITSLAGNAWLYNLRGGDVSHTPVFFSFTLISPDGIAAYVFKDALPDCLMPGVVEVKDYIAGGGALTIIRDLASLPGGSTIQVDMDAASYALYNAIPDNVQIIEDRSPTDYLKSAKNPVEIESTRLAHINDGAAVTKFIYWLKQNIVKTRLTELSASAFLAERRKEIDDYLDLSFETIAGYGPHGAIIHYGATPETNIPLEPSGFLLVDSGGQYISGTTDITRTIALGDLTDKMKECYTAVLQGHIDLAMAKVRPETTGIELDEIARKPIVALGFDYNHGTGHGVGHVSGVHEGPQSISKRGTGGIIPGMITSDEPGIYLENEFGIRIEGEILCVPSAASSADAASPEYEFDMLTCCPYEADAIITERLTDEQKKWLNDYNAWVREKLTPLLTGEEAEWLRIVTAQIQ